MIFGKIAKSNQEQAVASWINYLNQIRLDRLMEAINSQDINLKNSLSEIDRTFHIIDKNIIQRGRGGQKGMHGFIAEIAECGIGNARNQIKGKMPNYIWINDNGPVDFLKNGINIQQKFVNSGNHLSLQAIKKHLEQYPNYLNGGGKYQIPKDHYEKIKYLLSISKDEANKMATSNGEFSLKKWKEVNNFFANGEINLSDIEPSKLNYDNVQVNNIKGTLDNEKKSLRDTDKRIRKNAYEDSKPKFKEGMKATVFSAGIEGGTTFVLKIAQKRKSGKKINEFTESDWKDILKDTGISTMKGGVRGVSIYSLTNYTATSAATASSLCTASFGIAEQRYLLKKGIINEDEFIMNSEIACLDATVSALSSFIGQAVIPIPVFGAVIGNSVGTIMYQIAKDNLSKYEIKTIEKYMNNVREHNDILDKQYVEFIEGLNKEIKYYYKLLNKAFSPDVKIAMNGSVQLARWLGVPSDELLLNTDDVDMYFLY